MKQTVLKTSDSFVTVLALAALMKYESDLGYELENSASLKEEK